MSCVNIKTPVRGLFKIEAHTLDEHGEIVSTRILADWFPNLIVDQGLDRMGTAADYLTACQVGSGNATPLVTDTGMQSYVAGTNNQQSSTTSAGAPPDYYAKIVKVYRFAAGVATGNLSEIGVGWATSGSTLLSRALILDGMGNPTTITVLASEVLDVTYEFRTYPPLTDSVGVVTISGINYNFTARAANVDTVKGSLTTLGWGVFSNGTAAGGNPTQNGTVFSYSGAIGAVTDLPASASGTTFNGLFTASAYTNGTFSRVFSFGAALGELNAVGGIMSLVVSSAWFCYQIQFSPLLPKDNTKTMSLTFSHSWIRH